MEHDVYEELISRACDGDLSESEARSLRDHVAECDVCRSLLREYRHISDMVGMRQIMCLCPPLRRPSIERPRRTAKRAIEVIGAVAACAAAFFFGQHVGEGDASRRYEASLTPVAVATPSLWNASLKGTKTQDMITSETPFTDSIARYRQSVADEIRSGHVDWARVRNMLEAIGELRTDLELLTLHMAFLEINTGRSPDEVAEHWKNIGGGKFDNDREGALQP